MATVGAIWRVDNFDRRYPSKIPDLYVSVSSDVKYFSTSRKLLVIGLGFDGSYGLLLLNDLDDPASFKDQDEELIYNDLISGKLGEPIAGPNYFASGVKPKFGGSPNDKCCKDKYQCSCKLDIIMIHGCQCGGC